MHHLADVAAAVAARAAHDVDRVLVPLGGDETDLRAALLDDGVGADRGAVRQVRDVAAEPVERNAERLRAGAERIEHAAREVGRRGGNLGRQQLARAVDDGAVGKSAADVDADEVAHYAILASEAAPLTTLGEAPSLILPSCGPSDRVLSKPRGGGGDDAEPVSFHIPRSSYVLRPGERSRFRYVQDSPDRRPVRR